MGPDQRLERLPAPRAVGADLRLQLSWERPGGGGTKQGEEFSECSVTPALGTNSPTTVSVSPDTLLSKKSALPKTSYTRFNLLAGSTLGSGWL